MRVSHSCSREQKMGHPRNRFTDRAIRNLPPGMHADGHGLYVVVDESGARRWILRTMVQGRRPEIGLGGFPTVGLAQAREDAHRYRSIAKKAAILSPNGTTKSTSRRRLAKSQKPYMKRTHRHGAMKNTRHNGCLRSPSMYSRYSATSALTR